MKPSEKYIFEGNRCLVCNGFLLFDGHGDDCLVPELVQLEAENEALREFVEIAQSEWEEFGSSDGIVTVKYPWAVQEKMRELADTIVTRKETPCP